MKLIRMFPLVSSVLIIVAILVGMNTFRYYVYGSAEKQRIVEINSLNDVCAKEARAFYTGLPSAERLREFLARGRSAFSKYEPVEVVSLDRVEHLSRLGDVAVVDVRFCSDGIVRPIIKDYIAFSLP